MAVTPELLIIGAITGMAALAVVAMRRAADRPYDAAGPLLSAAERQLLEALREALAPDLVVFPRPRLGDVVRVRRRVRGKRRQVALARIADAHVGFALCDAGGLQVRAVVELDEGRHRGEAQRARDRLLDSVLRAAGLPLVRIPARDAYVTADLRDTVAAHLHGKKDAPASDATRPAEQQAMGVVARGPVGPHIDLHARLSALRAAVAKRLHREMPHTQTLIALGAGGLVLAIGAAWLLANGPSSRRPAGQPAAAQATVTADSPKPTLRDAVDSLLRRPAGERPKAADVPAPAVKPTPLATLPDMPREIVGWREEKVPGKPLEQCLGPDHEINPEVVRCRTGYTQRVPVYR